MKTSIVLTTYNGAKYIIDQLESIYNQTYHLDEVLIFDDGSTDNTPELVRKFINDNNLVDWQFTVNHKNKGWRRNFMDGLCVARGNIVFLADQDDVWRPEKIEQMSRAMEEDDKIQLLVSEYQAFYDNDLPDVVDKKDVVPVKIRVYPNIFNVLYPGCTYCARRELIHEASRFWTEDTAHDALLWRIALFNDTLYMYPRKLIYWRRHKNSSWTLEGVRNKNLEARIRWTVFAKGQVDIIQEFLINNNKMTAEKEQILIRNAKWVRLREELLKEKNVAAVFKLLFYLKYYNSFKQYLGDIYLTFVKSSE